MLSYTAEELLGKSLEDVTHPEDISQALENLHNLYTGNISLAHDEKRYLRKDGYCHMGIDHRHPHPGRGKPGHFNDLYCRGYYDKKGGRDASRGKRKKIP